MAVGYCQALPPGWVMWCWQPKGLDIQLSTLCFSPSQELQSTELHIPHSCSFVVLLQISTLWEILLVTSHGPMNFCPCFQKKWPQRG